MPWDFSLSACLHYICAYFKDLQKKLQRSLDTIDVQKKLLEKLSTDTDKKYRIGKNARYDLKLLKGSCFVITFTEIVILFLFFIFIFSFFTDALYFRNYLVDFFKFRFLNFRPLSEIVDLVYFVLFMISLFSQLLLSVIFIFYFISPINLKQIKKIWIKNWRKTTKHWMKN